MDFREEDAKVRTELSWLKFFDQLNNYQTHEPVVKINSCLRLVCVTTINCAVLGPG
jgi:hypothetical protein